MTVKGTNGWRFQYAVVEESYTNQTVVHASDIEEDDPFVVVEYLPFAPSVARVEGYKAHPLGGGGIRLLICPTIAAACAWYALWRYRRTNRILRHGTPILASIESCRAKTRFLRSNDNNVSWEFFVAGQRYTGGLVTGEAFDLSAVGWPNHVLVLYLPENPKMNTLWIERVAENYNP